MISDNIWASLLEKLWRPLGIRTSFSFSWFRTRAAQGPKAIANFLRGSHQMKKHNLKVLCHISLINANCAALRMKFVKPVQKGQEQSRNYSKDQQMKEAYTTCIYGTKNNKSCSIKTLRMLILPHKNVFMEVVWFDFVRYTHHPHYTFIRWLYYLFTYV